VYVDENGVVWTRPVKEFEEKMTLSEEHVSYVMLPLLSFQADEEINEEHGEILKYPENGM
jgi:hypothetical protein